MDTSRGRLLCTCPFLIGNGTVLTWQRELVTGDIWDNAISLDGPNDMIYAWQDGTQGFNKSVTGVAQDIRTHTHAKQHNSQMG